MRTNIKEKVGQSLAIAGLLAERIARQEEPTVRFQLRAGRLAGVKIGSRWKVRRIEVERLLEVTGA